MLFVTIRSASAMHVPKVLQVVEHTKRLRHKAGKRNLTWGLVSRLITLRSRRRSRAFSIRHLRNGQEGSETYQFG